MDSQKQNGVYYTPPAMVDYIVENVFQLVPGTVKLDSLRILDPSCGEGAFLLGVKRYLAGKGLDGANSLYGADIDPRSVAIAKSNTGSNHFVVGNSLVSDPLGINPQAINWKKTFPEVNGFDIVVGNPPWVQSGILSDKDKRYYEAHYYATKGHYDLFSLFVERSIGLLKEGGFLGFIIPDRFLTNPAYELFRKHLLRTVVLHKIITVGNNVFKNVTMPAAIIILQKPNGDIGKDNLVEIVVGQTKGVVKQSELGEKSGAIFSLGFVLNEGTMRKIENGSVALSELAINYGRGISIGKKSEAIGTSGDVPIVLGEDVDRYVMKQTKWLTLGLPDIEYGDCSIYNGEKILFRRVSDTIRATLDMDGNYVNSTLFVIKGKKDGPDIRYILGILNSKLMAFYFKNLYGEIFDIVKSKIDVLPIRVVPTRSTELVSIVETILEKNRKIKTTTDPTAMVVLIEEVRALEDKVNSIVYEIYGVSEEELVAAQ